MALGIVRMVALVSAYDDCLSVTAEEAVEIFGIWLLACVDHSFVVIEAFEVIDNKDLYKDK